MKVYEWDISKLQKTSKARFCHEVNRLFAGYNPELWVEYISAIILIGVAIWFGTKIGKPVYLKFGYLMPISLWCLSTLFVGVFQAVSIVSFDWRKRAVADAVAATYWLFVTIHIGFFDGFTILHPTMIVMALFCSLTVLRYMWRSTCGGS